MSPKSPNNDLINGSYINNTDLNTIKKCGHYLIGINCTNGPVTNWSKEYALFHVIGNGNDTGSQIFIARDNKAYYRVYSNGVWGSWFTIQTGVKYDSMNVTINNGDITLFDHKVEVIGIYVTNDTKYWAALPYFYGTTTCAKVFDFSVATPTYATGSATIGIYYREWQ